MRYTQAQLPQSATTTTTTAQANTQARAGALMAHHPAWWVITRVGPGQNPQYTRSHFGGRLWVAHQLHNTQQ